MSDVAIRVENLGKKYQLGGQKSGSFRESLSRIFQRRENGEGRMENGNPSSILPSPSSDTEFWALNDINFEIKRGEAVGIIGRNGAGKSTLLKILSRITEPTKGRYEIFGRVSSLLEVGTGFHPELSGRENVYLNGTILGMKRREVKAKFDEIVAFSGVEKFIDTPVKHYSSGMQVRLAFAVAAHLEPEILIIDEVLAVGDAEFQRKCLGKMEDVTGEGRTVIFVSHNMGIIKNLCHSGLLISKGKLQLKSDIASVVESYLKMPGIENEGKLQWVEDSNSPGTSEMCLKSVTVYDQNEKIKTAFNASDSINIAIEYKIFSRIKGMRIIIQVLALDGTVVFSTTNQGTLGKVIEPGIYCSTCVIYENLLNQGKYYIKIVAGVPNNRNLVPPDTYLALDVTSSLIHNSVISTNLKGVVAPKLQWESFQTNLNLTV